MKALIVRNNELMDMLNKAGIEPPPFTGPKLLRCIVTIQKKNSETATAEDSSQKDANDLENNLNKLNAIENPSVSTKPPPAVPADGKKTIGKTKERVKGQKSNKKPANAKIVLQLAFNTTFGQRKNVNGSIVKGKSSKTSAGKSKKLLCENTEPSNISENSSLEIISVREQTTAPANNDNDSVSVLPLFAEPASGKNSLQSLNSRYAIIVFILRGKSSDEQRDKEQHFDNTNYRSSGE